MADLTRRQLISCRDLRFPVDQADDATQGEIRRTVSEATDAPKTLEDFLFCVRSQIRLVQGTQAWTMPPSPVDPSAGNGPFEPGVGQVVLQERLDGVRDGKNRLFTLSKKAVGPSVLVAYNGLPQQYGQSRDYVLQESVADQGFDQVLFTGALAPTPRDEVLVSYVRSA